ncbi:YggS family pyridoxal phosphate-dependent enzyme [Mycolicibacterium gilvum]|uniref:Pyridoxal phosphate homeostasis protein n=1 Tax=Mycolicibacterium gilvum TaxID=1804 RepID=A0A378SN38_9MYCO|nr:YggS family pyridoxal phosphate-dependent enzyme [Mycolicibacterium gilvum]MCV7055596.1 YggS family pyridoxal phosphate-dependent enzyme [Mycolicibacterium gilvum]STZ44222.1 alanine racemase domain-containing protein [Mycolicibacterium gilvum]
MTSEREAELRAALDALRVRLARAAESAGRDVAEIELLPVTKFFPASDVLALYRLGCDAFAESRDQEATAKIEDVARVVGSREDTPIRWHMVGRIQRNKARSVAEWAYAAHSVDSVKVVAALERSASTALEEGRRTEPLRVFAQLSLDGDEARGGVDVDATERVDELCAAMDRAGGLTFAGMMAIPPLGADPGEAFARLRQERDRVQRDYEQRLGLSAGMSGDLEAAVRHGSTCVRVGTALMGSRPLTSPEVVTRVTPSSQTTPPLDFPESASPQEGSEQ